MSESGAAGAERRGTKNQRTVWAVHPKAYAERRRTTGYRTYYLIRPDRSAFMPIGDGDTAAKAWANAAERIRRATAKEG